MDLSLENNVAVVTGGTSGIGLAIAKASYSLGNPLGRIGRRVEIAAAASSLRSDASSFITGIEAFVDGGVAHV